MMQRKFAKSPLLTKGTLINSSWGLSPLVIKCPVCLDVVPRESWSSSVSQDLLTLYDKLNPTFKRLERSCYSCVELLTFPPFEPKKCTGREGISLQKINEATDPLVWKDLLFSHLQLYPNLECYKCLAVNCLLCGTKAHSGSCKELSLGKDCKSCPKCKILIVKEDGCNRMECSYCSHIFCWECLGSNCSFYYCKTFKAHSYQKSRSSENGIPQLS